MSEFSPSPEETSPQSEEFVFTDILVTPEWGELRKMAIEAENETMLFKDGDQENPHLLAKLKELVDELNEVFESDYYKQPCHVLCLAYSHEDVSVSETSGAEVYSTVFDNKKVAFYGVNFLYINQRWQAVVQLYQAACTNKQKNEFYYVPLRENSFMNLHIREPTGDEDDDPEDKNAIKLLDNHVVATREFVAAPEFPELPPETQREVLQQFTSDADEGLPQELRKLDVVVTCARYYTKYDDMPDFPITYSYTDLRKVRVHERQSLIGEIKGFEYPELQDIPADQQLTLRDFTINKGASCMVLRSDAGGGMTHYILPQTISDIL